MFTTTPFSAWDLKSELQEGITNLGWEFATQVQKETILFYFSTKALYRHLIEMFDYSQYISNGNIVNNFIK